MDETGTLNLHSLLVTKDGVAIERHLHRWVLRADDMWACSHVNQDGSACQQRWSNPPGVPEGGEGTHCWRDPSMEPTVLDLNTDPDLKLNPEYVKLFAEETVLRLDKGTLTDTSGRDYQTLLDAEIKRAMQADASHGAIEHLCRLFRAQVDASLRRSNPGRSEYGWDQAPEDLRGAYREAMLVLLKRLALFNPSFLMGIVEGVTGGKLDVVTPDEWVTGKAGAIPDRDEVPDGV